MKLCTEERHFRDYVFHEAQFAIPARLLGMKFVAQITIRFIAMNLLVMWLQNPQAVGADTDYKSPALGSDSCYAHAAAAAAP